MHEHKVCVGVESIALCGLISHHVAYTVYTRGVIGCFENPAGGRASSVRRTLTDILVIRVWVYRRSGRNQSSLYRTVLGAVQVSGNSVPASNNGRHE